jgi:hypothetical protein
MGASKAADVKSPRRQAFGVGMLAIGMIVTFIVVIGALNLYEFGRLD